jgi:cell division protease FtsH
MSQTIAFKKPEKLDKSKIKTRRKTLETVAVQLKSEFFGIDQIIDKVISSIQAWYIFPELITRPVIVNLWGMTGVGKTQLVRRLVSLLEFQEKFVEVQMDGGSITSSYNASTLTKLLSNSSIDESEPGILLLDEFQKFRTVDQDGKDVKLERFQDVWTLLSDGKFSSDSSVFNEIEMMLAYKDYYADSASEENKTEETPKKKERKYKIYPYEAKNLKKILRLSESIAKIMQWENNKILNCLDEIRTNRITWEIDYTKLVIFISGNLDEAFNGSGQTDDCDTDADYYHELTKKITSTEIKANLRRRFKPEQISRFGNNHIIYPSLNKESYQKLIHFTCMKYINEMTEVSDIKFILNKNVEEQIYDNSVYPTQGTRPVFSSIHLIFSSVLVDVAFWCLENDIKQVDISMSDDVKSIVASANDKQKNFHIELELNEKRAKTSNDFKIYVATHEAGHALVYAILTGAAPFEVKINTASYTGGYMLPVDEMSITTKKNLRDRICVYLAGRAAEEIIFGADNRSSGCANDINYATKYASKYIRQYGFDRNISYIDAEAPAQTNFNTDLFKSNGEIEGLLSEELKRATLTITNNIVVFKKIVNKIINKNTVTQNEFIDMLSETMPLTKKNDDDKFVNMWKNHSINS